MPLTTTKTKTFIAVYVLWNFTFNLHAKYLSGLTVSPDRWISDVRFPLKHINDHIPDSETEI
jgi:hypothetical protein